MLRGRKRKDGGDSDERESAHVGGGAALRVEVRLEVEEDGRTVFSRPILRLPAHFGSPEPLRDIGLDLRTGRGLGVGGFVALDFETATSSRASACAVAVASVDGGRVTAVERWLIRPPDNEYDPFNVAIHGIRPDITEDSPSIADVWPSVLEWIDRRPLVAHYAPFDMSVLRNSLAAVGSKWPELTYYCTCALGRRAWPGRLSYRLPDLASECGLDLEHHEPGADAATAATLAVACCGAADAATLGEASSVFGMVAGRLSTASWTPAGLAPVRLADLEPTVELIPEGSPFCNTVVVFTGTLSCGLTRREAAERVVNAGGKVAVGISKKVDFLVLGIQDAFRVRDGEHSSKMIRAAELRAGGSPIELLDEEDFLRMLPA